MKISLKTLNQALQNDGREGVTKLVRALAQEKKCSGADVFFLAYWCDNITLLEAVLDAKLEVNVTNGAGASPLYYAASVGFREKEALQRRVCDLLINAGADVNRHHQVRFNAPPNFFDGDTALMTAARTNATTIVELLLSKGADPSLKDARGFNAYDHANTCDSREAAALLEKLVSRF